tara:strand:- start:27 stop:1913 length:1887 start_codon:yes stop_codon:yes gene_type:complete
MDKNTGLYIVLGFLLLCIFLSLDKKEGFATINASEFETACNAGENTCIINTSGSRGFNCSIPNDDIPYYNISGSNTHSESFDIQVSGCSNRAYQSDDGITPSASPCNNSGGTYNLSGCEPKCIRPTNLEGYNLSNPPEFLEPHRTAFILSNNMGLTDSNDGSSCSEGYYPAKNICFSRINGEIISHPTATECSHNNGIWYNSDGFPVGFSGSGAGVGTEAPLQGDKIKFFCSPGGNPYSVMGCEQGCLSRNRNYDEYITSDGTDANKEFIQILDRTDPDNSDDTIIKYPISDSTPYNMVESAGDGTGLLNPSAFGVSEVTLNNVNFKEDIADGTETSINIEFGGDISVTPCPINDETKRKYIVSGLFPICDDDHECLNFNITYDSNAPMNITEFKDSMPDNATDILGTDATTEDITKYQNSLYYYRRYKDNDDKINIEGQIRCNDNPNSPFNCEIISSVFDSSNPYYLANTGQVRENCNTVCSSHGLACDSEFTYNDFGGEDLSYSRKRYAIQDLIMNSNGWEDSYEWNQARVPGGYGTAELSNSFSGNGSYSEEDNVPLFITYQTDQNILRFGMTRGYFENDRNFDGDRPLLSDNIGDVCNYVIPQKTDDYSWIGDNSRQVCKCKQP